MSKDENWGAMPFERMIAVLRYRGLDAEAMRLAQQRQIDTMREAGDILTRTMQDIGERQTALMKETMDRVLGAMPNKAADGNLVELTARQAEMSREQIDASLAAFKSIAEMMWTCGRSALDLVNRTMNESIEVMMKANGNANLHDAGEPADKAPPKVKPRR